MTRLTQIEDRLQPLRTALLNHPIYEEIDRIESLQIFMQHHIYAVWDFMSLLKVLQRQLTCVSLPWVPTADPQGCRLVNEIVLAEESDHDGEGGYASHFELYLRSMRQCGACTLAIDDFLNRLRRGKLVMGALEATSIPASARRFVRHTFQIIDSENLPMIASAFTFGREDLLPDVFRRIVESLNTESAGRLQGFKYYLERHIELDADEHGPMAARLLSSLCGSDDSKWQQAEEAAVDSLTARRELWDGIYAAVKSEKTSLREIH